MSNSVKAIAAMSACCLLMPVMTSCGGDEPKAGGNGTIVEIDGTRVTGINDYSISYDNNGRPCTLESDDSKVSIDYEKGKIRVIYDEDEPEELNVKFSNGYISEFSEKQEVKEEEGQYKLDGKLKLSYSNGYLTEVKWDTEEVYKYKENNYTSKYIDKTVVKLKWEKGILVYATEYGYIEDDGEKDEWTDEYAYDYDLEENMYQQMPITLSYSWAEESEWAVFGAVGLFGKGPVLLPSSANSRSITFDLNANGSIKTERSSEGRFNYIYGLVSRSLEGKTQKSNLKKFRSIFSHKNLSKE